jgi:hypothetical protein
MVGPTVKIPCICSCFCWTTWDSAAKFTTVISSDYVMTAKLSCDIGARHLLMYQVRLWVIEVLRYPESHMVLELLRVTKTTGIMHMICETVILVLLAVFNKVCLVCKRTFRHVAQVVLYCSEQNWWNGRRISVVVTVQGFWRALHKLLLDSLSDWPKESI